MIEYKDLPIACRSWFPYLWMIFLLNTWDQYATWGLVKRGRASDACWGLSLYMVTEVPLFYFFWSVPSCRYTRWYSDLHGTPNRTLMLIFWYQKMIFWYQKRIFWYQKLIFWYQKLISDIRKSDFSYQKIIGNFWCQKIIFWYQKLISDQKMGANFYIRISCIFWKQKIIFLLSENIFWYQKLFSDVRNSDFFISENNFWYQKIEFLISENRH